MNTHAAQKIGILKAGIDRMGASNPSRHKQIYDQTLAQIRDIDRVGRPSFSPQKRPDTTPMKNYRLPKGFYQNGVLFPRVYFIDSDGHEVVVPRNHYHDLEGFYRSHQNAIHRRKEEERISAELHRREERWRRKKEAEHQQHLEQQRVHMWKQQVIHEYLEEQDQRRRAQQIHNESRTHKYTPKSRDRGMKRVGRRHISSRQPQRISQRSPSPIYIRTPPKRRNKPVPMNID